MSMRHSDDVGAIETAAVIGAGTMGHGIAQVAAMAGWATTLYDVMQAMSYVARSKTNANVQQKMLRGLDGLLGMLGRAA